jgi:hypothetical protein
MQKKADNIFIEAIGFKSAEWVKWDYKNTFIND